LELSTNATCVFKPDLRAFDLTSQYKCDKRVVTYTHVQTHLLCVSCHSANEFLAILFLLFTRSSLNSPRSLEGFRQTLVPKFIQIRRWVKNLPIDPYCKMWPHSATLYMYRCRKRAIFTMGVCGEILHLLSNPVEISPKSSSKTLKWSR